MRIRTEISVRHFPRPERPALRAALTTPGCRLTYDQAKLLQRYNALLFVQHPTRLTRMGLGIADRRVERLEAGRQLRAHAYGDTVESLRQDALRQGFALFGGDAELEIVSVEDIATAHGSKGAFHATVTVRMLPPAAAAIRKVA
jgi:hypothetical protein